MKIETKKYFLLIILHIVVFAGCETSPPLQPDSNNSAKVFIQSNVDSASIFVDGSFTGKYTPDTITVTAGIRVISLEKEGYQSGTKQINLSAGAIQSVEILLASSSLQKTILIEDFANVSCVPCVTSNKILQSLSSSYGHDKLLDQALQRRSRDTRGLHLSEGSSK